MKIMYQQINDCSTVKKEQTIIRKWQEWEKKKKSGRVKSFRTFLNQQRSWVN